jgi:hypothetical protein
MIVSWHEYRNYLSNNRQAKKIKTLIMKNLKILFSALLITGALIVAQNAVAQNNEGAHDINVSFDGITLLDVVSPNANQDITLSGEWGSVQAGEEITENTVLASNEENRLHYTVFNPQGGNNTYKISVGVSGFEGSGWDIDITLQAGNFDNPNANGTVGSTTGLRDNSGADVVTGIGKIAWTGTDESADGYGLLYELKVTDFDTFEAGNDTNPITVTYTLSEE